MVNDESQVRLPSVPVEQDNPFLGAEMRGEDEVVRSLTRSHQAHHHFTITQHLLFTNSSPPFTI